MDVKTAFLNGFLKEEVFMTQPKGFESKGQEHMVCKHQKSIYGLKQDSRSWNLHFDEVVKGNNFIKNEDEPCVYTRRLVGVLLFSLFFMWMTYCSLEMTFSCCSPLRFGYQRTSP